MTSKYRAVQTYIDGIRFASQKEGMHYSELKLLELAGKISNLELQVKYKIEVNGVKICDYIADFVYLDNQTGKKITCDVKGMATPVYRLKKKLMLAVHGIEIQEI